MALAMALAAFLSIGAGLQDRPGAAGEGSSRPAAPPAQEQAAEDDPPTPSAESGAENQPAAKEMNQTLVDAVRRGLDHLANLQNTDGSFGRGRDAENAGVVALCGIALLADGHMPGRGRHGEVVRRSLDFILDQMTTQHRHK